MLRELFLDNGVYANEDEVDDKNKSRPIEHWPKPSQDVLPGEEGGLAEKKAGQGGIVPKREPFRYMIPEKVPPIIFRCGEPEGVDENP